VPPGDGETEARIGELSERKRALLERLRSTGGRLPDGTLIAARNPLVPLKGVGSGRTLFLVHAVSGSAYSYAPLAERLRADAPVVGLEAPGLAGEQAPVESLTELAARYVRAVRGRQPRGPYRIGGWSMGGTVAFEMAQQLVGAGQEVDAPVLIDSDAPGLVPDPDEDEVVRTFVSNLAGVLGAEEPALDPVLDGSSDPEARLGRLHELLVSAGLLQDVDRGFLRNRYAVFRANMRAVRRYDPKDRFPGRITLVRAERSPDHRARWARLAAQVDELLVPGDHYTMWAGDNLPMLAAAVDDCIGRG